MLSSKRFGNLRENQLFPKLSGTPSVSRCGASEQAADGIADGEAANVNIQGLIIVLEEFMNQAEVARRDH